MRRIALLVLCLGATGCEQYVSSPFVGFGTFLADTHTIERGPNSPPGNSTNMQRVRGSTPEVEPLVPEPGNVWPGPAEALPTLEDLIKESPNASQLQPGQEMSMTPGARLPGMPLVPSTSSALPRPAYAPGAPPPPAGTTGPGMQTFTAPGGGTGLMVPNGNGTSTLIAPDGTVKTVPTPQ